MKEAIITDKELWGRFWVDKGTYMYLYNCSSCYEEECLRESYRFCPYCGVKLVWRIEQ